MQRLRRKIKSESELRALLMEQGLAFSYDLLIDLLKRAVSQQRRQGDREGIIAQIVAYSDDEISASFRSLDHDVTVTREPGEASDREKMSDADFSLYLALLVSKLNSWKFAALPHLPPEMVMKHPCDIQADVLVVNAIKRFAPDLSGGTLGEMEERVERYLFSREPDLA